MKCSIIPDIKVVKGSISEFIPQTFGVEVERVPRSSLMSAVNRCVQEDNMTFLHSYDDLDLIAGHARFSQLKQNLDFFFLPLTLYIYFNLARKFHRVAKTGEVEGNGTRAFQLVLISKTRICACAAWAWRCWRRCRTRTWWWSAAVGAACSPGLLLPSSSRGATRPGSTAWNQKEVK